MPSARMRIPIDHQNSISGGRDFDVPDRSASTFSDMVFGFLEDGNEGSLASSGENYPRNEIMLEEEDEEKVNGGSVEEDKTFWENQNQLLQATICKTSSLETNIRSIVKEAIKEIQMTGTVCSCGRPMADGCRNCLMREVSGRLRNAGYDSAICKTKWRTSPDIPAGEHTFLDVIDNSNSKKKVETKVIIELNFRSKFELAKASEEYNRLVRRLPEVFVGKVERLNNVIKILCLAAKKCMKKKKMHLGPWRKSRYMQAKWLGPCERTTSMAPLPMGYSGGQRRPKASMLTVDLLEMYPNMHCAAVEVVCFGLI